MRIAAATEDGRTVAQHFGRAPRYVVLTVENGAVTETEVRPKAGHQTFAAGPGPEPAPREKHAAMIEAITDCAAVVAGGMGPGARQAMEAAGIAVVLTAEPDAAAAAIGYATGDLASDPDRTCHEGPGHSH